MLTFDVDGVSGALNQNPDSGKLPSFMSAREYGPSVATPRILEMLDVYGIKATFYVPGYVAETHTELVEEIARRGHEIGHHGYIHEPPATLTREQEGDVLDKGISIIEGITGSKPVGYRSPSWELSEHSIELLSERGFEYDSSLMGNDIPYIEHSGGTSMVEIPVHWEYDDAPYYNYAPALGARNVMASPQQVYDVWSAGFEGVYHYGRSFMLTMHPYVSGRPGRLRMVERLIQYIAGFPSVEFMRAIDVARMFSDHR